MNRQSNIYKAEEITINGTMQIATNDKIVNIKKFLRLLKDLEKYLKLMKEKWLQKINTLLV